jgi:hypothetical protein
LRKRRILKNRYLPMSTPYETDAIAWANEQAALLRGGRLAEIDIEPEACPWTVAQVLDPGFQPD